MGFWTIYCGIEGGGNSIVYGHTLLYASKVAVSNPIIRRAYTDTTRTAEGSDAEKSGGVG